MSAALIGLLLTAYLVAPVLAASPSPTPVPKKFPTPQDLVWVDYYDYLTFGRTVVKNYMLVAPKYRVAPGKYYLPDSTGGKIKFSGHDISGPYTYRTDLCPFMKVHKIDNLPTAPTLVEIPNVMKAECDAAAAAAASAAAASPGAGQSPALADANAGTLANGGNDPGSAGIGDTGGGIDPVAMEIAIALILLVLGIGGVKVLGVAAGVGPFATRPVSPLDEGAPPYEGVPSSEPAPSTAAPVLANSTITQKPDDHTQRTDDPCSTEASALAGVSGHAKGLNSVLATLRDFSAQLDQQIVLIEKAAIPAEAGVETAFLAGGAIGGKVGPGWIPDILLGKIFEGVAKDQLKGLIKNSIANAAIQAPDGPTTARDMRDATAEATLKGMMEDALSNHYLHESIKGYHTSGAALVNSLPGKFEMADKIAGHMADAVGHLITVYSTGMNIANLVQQSAVLRQKRATILDDIANIEGAFDHAVEQMTTLAEDLQRCRWVHSSTKEPLRPGLDAVS